MEKSQEEYSGYRREQEWIERRVQNDRTLLEEKVKQRQEDKRTVENKAVARVACSDEERKRNI